MRPRRRRTLVNGVHLAVETRGDGPPLVLLHGFTGSTATWAPIARALSTRFLTVAIDLLGHGRSDAPGDPERYGIERSAADLLAVLDRLELPQVSVLGYSMGGRLALFLASAAPERVRALIVESASPGIAGEADRQVREAQDAALAASIEREGVPAFVDRWERHPLFATQCRLSRATRARLRAQRLVHTAHGLANSLRGMGQGAQPPLHDRLCAIRAPALVVVGELDAGYCAIGRELTRLIPGARFVVAAGAGHAVHLEQPETFRRIVSEFLTEVTASPPAR